MTKLLDANFFRLKRSICFWIILFLMFFHGIYIYINYNGLHPFQCGNCSNELGSVLFHFLIGSFFVLPIFTTIFMKPLYGDGIIKNMVIIGHKRENIYMANLITTIIVNLLFCFSFALGTILTGLVLVNNITVPLDKLIFLFFDAVILSVSYASLFNFISLSFDKNAACVSFIVVIWSFIISSNIFSRYRNILDSRLHNIYEFILSIIPIGQGLLINDYAGNYKLLWLYSLVFIVIINYLGLFIIKKKKFN